MNQYPAYSIHFIDIIHNWGDSVCFNKFNVRGSEDMGQGRASEVGWVGIENYVRIDRECYLNTRVPMMD